MKSKILKAILVLFVLSIVVPLAWKGYPLLYKWAFERKGGTETEILAEWLEDADLGGDYTPDNLDWLIDKEKPDNIFSISGKDRYDNRLFFELQIRRNRVVIIEEFNFTEIMIQWLEESDIGGDYTPNNLNYLYDGYDPSSEIFTISGENSSCDWVEIQFRIVNGEVSPIVNETSGGHG